MNIFERWFGKSEEQKSEEAIESLEKHAEKELEKMSPEEKKKFFEGRKEVKRKNL